MQARGSVSSAAAGVMFVLTAAVLGLAAVWGGAAAWGPAAGPVQEAPATAVTATHQQPADESAGPEAAAIAQRPPQHPVLIHAIQPPVGAATELRDHQGRPVTIACVTCHTARPANPANRAAADLNEFHRGLHYSHGQLACVACHNSGDGYATLHLADGRAVDYADTMTLCAQCHGIQFRDYQNGSHGGMTGYWDLTRGPRQRNHCLDCHDPHAPQYPRVQPAAKPRDRFPPASKDSAHE